MAIRPARMIAMAMTQAKIGRSMKNFGMGLARPRLERDGLDQVAGRDAILSLDDHALSRLQAASHDVATVRHVADLDRAGLDQPLGVHHADKWRAAAIAGPRLLRRQPRRLDRGAGQASADEHARQEHAIWV